MIKKLIVLAILVFFVQSAQASKRDPEESQELPSSAKKTVQPARPVNAECMKATATNQRRATEYIIALMQNSTTADRPPLIENQTCDSDIAYNEVKVILDRAERMAQSGMANKITEPDFRFNGSE